MKTINEIENLSLEELERISRDESIAVPAGLEVRARRAIAWQSIRIPLGIAAAVAVIAGVGMTISDYRQPKDTFTDPELAYAQLEKTLGYVSSKVSEGVEIARNAGPDKADPFTVLK